MRIWSLHPEYLDTKGLVALWRETLLAQKVLKGETKGYTKHPQLIRFKETSDPLCAISEYLRETACEADRRNYNFNKDKIGKGKFKGKITVTTGQMEFELKHLLGKLKKRDPEKYNSLKKIKEVKPHPLFIIKEGKIESWEIV